MHGGYGDDGSGDGDDGGTGGGDMQGCRQRGFRGFRQILISCFSCSYIPGLPHTIIPSHTLQLRYLRACNS